jgi:hypothetical protein
MTGAQVVNIATTNPALYRDDNKKLKDFNNLMAYVNLTVAHPQQPAVQ